jgi:hypothetical protein
MRFGSVRQCLKTLRRRAARYQRSHGSHPWLKYVREVCRVVARRFPNDEKVRAINAAIKRAATDYHDGDAPFGYGFWVNSDTQQEVDCYAEVCEDLGNSGSLPVEAFYLGKLASSEVLAILENIATGIGLLLRADATNSEVNGIR